MTVGDWLTDIQNWVFLLIGLTIFVTGFRVVTSQNVVHAALFLVGTLAATAGLFLLLSAEFVAWALVLVYIGAVVILFLFGIMITRAPIGREAQLDNTMRWPAALVSLALFVVMAWSSWKAFGTAELTGIGDPTSTELLADSLMGRFVLPFEVVSFVLLAALVGGITLARKDASPAEEEAAKAQIEETTR